MKHFSVIARRRRGGSGNRKSITTTGAVASSPILFTIYPGSGTDSTSTKTFYLNSLGAFTDFRDVNFTDSTLTALTHAIHHVEPTGSFATVLVEPNAQVVSDGLIYCSVGDTNAVDTSDYDNIDAFVDPFKRSSPSPVSANCPIYSSSISCGTHLWQNTPFYNGEFYVVTTEYFWSVDWYISLRKFNPSTEKFSLPIIIDTSKAQDYHNYGTCVVDSSGTSHVFYGCHNTQLYYRSISASLVKGSVISLTGATSATYPQPVITSSGDIYIFWRHGANLSGGAVYYKKSTDNGSTWSSSVTAVSLGTASGCYFTVNIDASDNIHIIATKRTGEADSPADFSDVIYAVMETTTDTWSTAGGTAITLPISQSNGDMVEIGTGFHPGSIAIHPDTDVAYLAYAKDSSTSGYFFEADVVVSHWSGSSWVKEQTSSSADNRYYAQLHIDSDGNFTLLNSKVISAVAEAYEYKKPAGGSWDSGIALTTGSASSVFYPTVTKSIGAPYFGMWSIGSEVAHVPVSLGYKSNDWEYNLSSALNVSSSIFFQNVDLATDRRVKTSISLSSDFTLSCAINTSNFLTGNVAIVFGVFTHDENYATTLTNASSDAIVFGWYNNAYRLYVVDGTTVTVGGAANAIASPIDKLNYVDMIKDGNTVTLNIFKDYKRTLHVTDSPLTVDVTGATFGTFNYLQVSNRIANTTGSLIARFNDVKLVPNNSTTITGFGSW